MTEADLKAYEEEYGVGDVDDDIAEIDLPQPVVLGSLKISARRSPVKGGQLGQYYPSDGRPLPKNIWLRFSIEHTSVPLPYAIRWTVTNHGREATAAHDLGHVTDPGAPAQWEQTRYHGSHLMTCELYRNGQVLARATHRVNIR
jgi:hypothetical protein